MHVIGQLKTTSTGGYTGYLTTLAATDPIALEPIESPGDHAAHADAPTYRVTRPGIATIGQAWTAYDERGRAAIIQIDDPGFRAPITADLIHISPRTAQLVWTDG